MVLYTTTTTATATTTTTTATTTATTKNNNSLLQVYHQFHDDMLERYNKAPVVKCIISTGFHIFLQKMVIATRIKEQLAIVVVTATAL